MRGFKQYNNAFRSPRQRLKSATWCHYSLRIANHVTTNKNDPASSPEVQAVACFSCYYLFHQLPNSNKAGWNDRYLMLTTVLFTLELLRNVYLSQMEKSHVTFLSLLLCARIFHSETLFHLLSTVTFYSQIYTMLSFPNTLKAFKDS